MSIQGDLIGQSGFRDLFNSTVASDEFSATDIIIDGSLQLDYATPNKNLVTDNNNFVITEDKTTLSGSNVNQIEIVQNVQDWNLSLPQDIGVLSNVVFNNVNATVEGIDVSDLKDDVDGFPDELKTLTTAEIQQVANINSTTVSATQWGYVGELDQSLTSTSNVSFGNVNSTVEGIDVSDLKDDVDGFPDELKTLTTAEIQQVANIGLKTVSNTQWGYVGELDQSLTSISNVSFGNVNSTVEGIDVSDLKDDVDGFPDELKTLTTAEIQQVANINLHTVSNTQWGYVGDLNQSLTSTSNVVFNNVNATVEGIDVSDLKDDVDEFPDELKTLTTIEIQQLSNINSTTVSATQWGYVGGLDQSLKISDNVTFNNVTTSNKLLTNKIDLEGGHMLFEDLADDKYLILQTNNNDNTTGITFQNNGLSSTHSILRIESPHLNTATNQPVLSFSAGTEVVISDMVEAFYIVSETGKQGNIHFVNDIYIDNLTPDTILALDSNNKIVTEDKTTLSGSNVNQIEIVQTGQDWNLSLPQDIGTNSNVRVNNLRVSNGSAAVPGFSFKNSEDMGMYRVADNVIGFSIDSIGRCQVGDNAFRPTNNTIYDLGSSSHGWNDAHIKRVLTDVIKITDNTTSALLIASEDNGVFMDFSTVNNFEQIKFEQYNFTNASKFSRCHLSSADGSSTQGTTAFSNINIASTLSDAQDFALSGTNVLTYTGVTKTFEITYHVEINGRGNGSSLSVFKTLIRKNSTNLPRSQCQVRLRANGSAAGGDAQGAIFKGFSYVTMASGDNIKVRVENDGVFGLDFGIRSFNVHIKEAGFE